jgi:hypothetical protein
MPEGDNGKDGDDCRREAFPHREARHHVVQRHEPSEGERGIELADCARIAGAIASAGPAV